MTESKELPAPHPMNNEFDWRPTSEIGGSMVWPKDKPLVRVRLSQGFHRGDIVTDEHGRILVIKSEFVSKRSVRYMNKIYLGYYVADEWFGCSDMCEGPGDWRNVHVPPYAGLTKIGELGPHDTMPNVKKYPGCHSDINTQGQDTPTCNLRDNQAAEIPMCNGVVGHREFFEELGYE